MSAPQVGGVLTLVVTLPPEPPVDTVLRVVHCSRMWKRSEDGWRIGWLDDTGWYSSSTVGPFPWSEVCDDAPLTVVSLPGATS